MPPTRRLVRATLIALSPIVLAAPRDVGAQTADSAIGARIDSLFAPWTGTDRPGCAVGVSHGGRVLLERGYGMADLESGAAMSPSTIVHSASLAKSVTAFAVLLLEREGKLALDDDVRRYLPELPDYRARYGTPITIRHLLTHTSGLRDFFEMLILARGRFEEDRVTDADATAVILRQTALNFAPGTQYSYTNTGYLLAAKIVARLSGQSFGSFVEARILAPLGMRDTHVRDDVATLVPRRALGYARRGGAWRTSVPNFDVVGSTNLLTTTGDLLRWADHLARPTAGDSAIVWQMLTPAALTGGEITAYGLGLALVRDRGFHVAEHEGRDPGFRAYLGWYREPDVAVALLCNAAALDPVGLGHRVAAATLDLPAAVPAPSASPVAPSAEGARRALGWAGVYLEPSTRQVAELTVRDGALYTDRTGGARVEAIDAHTARLVGQPLELDFEAGTRAGYRLRWLIPGRRADRFQWRAPRTLVLRHAELAVYAGSYASKELDATFLVEAGDSTISVRFGTTPGLVARPVFPDGFVSGQYTIQFVRARGRVTGFEISHPRARGLAFLRARAAR